MTTAISATTHRLHQAGRPHDDALAVVPVDVDPREEADGQAGSTVTMRVRPTARVDWVTRQT